MGQGLLRRRRWLMVVLVLALLSVVFPIRDGFESLKCDCRGIEVGIEKKMESHSPLPRPPPIGEAPISSPLSFIKSKLVLLVSHELSFSGVGAEVMWITNQKPSETDNVVYNLELKMLDRGVQVISAGGQEADLVVLNTTVAGKWLDVVVKETVPGIAPKILWWIHETRGHYFNLDYVKHLPIVVAGAMIDSHVTAEYWKNRTQERLRILLPSHRVIHLVQGKWRIISTTKMTNPLFKIKIIQVHVVKNGTTTTATEH